MALTYTLITGASTGIGAELARVAARNRRNLILTARSADKLNTLADELRTTHRVEVVVIPADLAQPGEVARLWEAAAADDRRINFLMNNAGLGAYGPVEAGAWAREKTSIDVNVLALSELCSLAVPNRIETGRGRILNVASVAGFIAGPGMAVYAATKNYVLSYSVALNAELQDKGVTVTALCPGATQTEFFAAADMQSSRMVQGRLPTAKSVAEFGYGAAVGERSVAVPGLMNNLLALLTRVLPRTTIAQIAKRTMAPDTGG